MRRRDAISSLEAADDAFIMQLEKHTDPVRGLEFRAHSPNLLASGADEGELCIWDLAQPLQPSLYPSLRLNFPAAPVQEQPAASPFVPATPHPIRNVNQYQQPSLESQSYPGTGNYIHQPGLYGPAQGVGVPLPGPPSTNPGGFVPSTNPGGFVPATNLGGFVPATNPGFVPRSGFSPAQSSSPTRQAQGQPIAAPLVPPPTVQTVDTSSVPAELKPVITTLTRLYHESSEALGGSHANASKKHEIEDNSRKIAALFGKLNSGDISPNAATKLTQLCHALDSGDFAGAFHIQAYFRADENRHCSGLNNK